MKKTLRLICATMLLCSFAACTDKDNETNPPANGGNTGGGDASVQFAIGAPQWEREGNIYYVSYEWTATLTDTALSLATFTEDGREYSYGIGYFPEGAEGDRLPQYFNGPNDYTVNSHEIIATNADNTEFTIRSRCKADNRKQARAWVYLSDGVFHYSDQFIMDPNDYQGGTDANVGVSIPTLLDCSATSLTLKADLQLNGDINPDDYRQASCGFIWVPATEGAPVMGSDNYIDCLQSAFEHQGQYFEGTITGLTPNTQYNVVAYIRLAPDGELIMGDWNTHSTIDNGGDNGDDDTNYVNLISVMPINATTLSVTITAYFDGNPTGCGVVYNTTGNPTTADNLYNGLEHFNPETGNHDATIQRLLVNPDGSKTVAALIDGLRPNTTYYIRGYATLSNGTTLYSTNEETATTTAE